MDQWIKDKLTSCLGFPVPEEMINYILSIKKSEEFDEYFKTLLNYELQEHKTFLTELKQRLSKKMSPPNNSNINNNNNSKKKQQNNVNNKNNKKGDKEKGKPNEIASQSSQNISKKKTKYVNLYTQDGEMNDIIMIKGRHRCDCQATKHKLVNNCLKCGRIVCEQEGSGPCLFCGSLVCSDEELHTIESSTKKGDYLKKSLSDQQRPKGWEEALAQRNRLLEYDRSSEKRTTVIDDESDYFKTNSVWLTDAERKKLETIENDMRKKKHASRLNKKMTIDFAGRQIIEESQFGKNYENEILTEIAQATANNPYSYIDSNLNDKQDSIHAGIDGPLPIFDDSITQDLQTYRQSNLPYDGVFNKIQDNEYLKMSDLRNCLSMHQPYASLLVAGIKKHEGRTWYTSHRGRLWIASAAKNVDGDDMRRIETFYRKYYNDETIKFPSQYPAACLLGYVSIDDCLPQEEYRKVYPQGESESPFVLICSDFQELPIHFPIRGEHKIYKIDPKIHYAAVKSLQRMSRLLAED